MSPSPVLSFSSTLYFGIVDSAGPAGGRPRSSDLGGQWVLPGRLSRPQGSRRACRSRRPPRAGRQRRNNASRPHCLIPQRALINGEIGPLILGRRREGCPVTKMGRSPYRAVTPQITKDRLTSPPRRGFRGAANPNGFAQEEIKNLLAPLVS